MTIKHTTWILMTIAGLLCAPGMATAQDANQCAGAKDNRPGQG